MITFVFGKACFICLQITLFFLSPAHHGENGHAKTVTAPFQVFRPEISFITDIFKKHTMCLKDSNGNQKEEECNSKDART